jgi:hypothetical protein
MPKEHSSTPIMLTNLQMKPTRIQGGLRLFEFIRSMDLIGHPARYSNCSLQIESNRGKSMKVTTVLSTAILILLPGAIVPAYSQGHEQEKQPEQKQQQARPAQRQQQAQPAKQAQQAQHPQQSKPAQQPQRTASRPQAQPAKPTPQGQQAKPVQQPQRAASRQQAQPAQQPQRAATRQQAQPERQPQRAEEQQRASRGSQTAAGHGSIPEDRFRASFGRGHTFHVNRSEFANGSGRFQYGGFWFNVVQPWPVGWLYTDSVYVDYLNGGYFLCDPVHPGVYISVNIG